jgi:hypothetical protein
MAPMARAAAMPPYMARPGIWHPPVLGEGVDDGGRHADGGSGQAAQHRQEDGLGDELVSDVAAGGAQGAPSMM